MCSRLSGFGESALALIRVPCVIAQGAGGTPDEAEKAQPTFHFTSLAGLADQHRQALEKGK